MGDCNKINSEYFLVKTKEDEAISTELPRFGKRHIQAICLFLSLSVALTVRAQLSVTIVAMTDVKKVNNTDFNTTTSFINNTVITKYYNDVEAEEELNNINVKDIKNINKHIDISIIKHNIDMINNEVSNIEGTVEAIQEEFNNFTLISNNFSHLTTMKSEIPNYDKDASLDNILGWSVYRTYNWPKSTQELVTSSFFVGYTTMQLPMGVISQHYGGKLPILVALFVNAVLSIITPWVAIVGWWAVCSCRLLQGMTQAAMYPGIQAMLGKWAPVSERGRLTTRVFTGSQFGTIVAFQLAGFLAGSSTFGWPSSFWVSGLLSMACFVLLFFFGAATPAEHPTISDSEKEYIMGHFDKKSNDVKRVTPWRSILLSVPVWAMVAAHAGSTFSYLFLLIEMPLYMSKILHVNIRDNGLFSSLPYIAMWTTSICMGQISDFVINRGLVSIINIRRICNSIGMVVCAVLMVAFSYAESVPLAVTLLVLSIASHAGVQTGFLINQIDLAPNFAGTLMAIANLVGNFVTLGAPLLVSIIVTDVENQSQWRIVFLITAGVMLVTNVIFVVFVKVDIQPWNDVGSSEDVSREFEYEKITKVIYVTHNKKNDDSVMADEEESAV